MTVTDANGCKAKAVKVVVMDSLPVAKVTANGPTTFCQGGSVTLTANVGSSYLWSYGGGLYSYSQSIIVTNVGNYNFTVTVTDSNGCSATSLPVTVVISANPSIPIISESNVSSCGSMNLTASTSNAYLWSTGETTQVVNASASGNYLVTVTNANGCTATSAVKSVTVKVVPVTANVTPSVLNVGDPQTMVVVGGSGFAFGQDVIVNGVIQYYGGQYLNPGSFGVILTAQQLSAQGTLSIQIGYAGCGYSNPQTVTVDWVNQIKVLTLPQTKATGAHDADFFGSWDNNDGGPIKVWFTYSKNQNSYGTPTQKVGKIGASGLEAVSVSGLDANSTYYVYFNVEKNGVVISSNPVAIQTLDNVGIDEVEKNATFSFGPNPLKDGEPIKISSLKSGQISFYNLKGQKLFSSPLKRGDNEINLPSFPAGIYFISNGQSQAMRLIIE